MKEPPITIVIANEKDVLKALRLILELTYREFVVAAEEVQARKIKEN